MDTQEVKVTQNLTPDYVKSQLIRLFNAVEDGFRMQNPEAGYATVKAVELIEFLAETVEKDPTMIATVITEQNLASCQRLQAKAASGKIGLSDVIKEFPQIAGAISMKGITSFFKM